MGISVVGISHQTAKLDYRALFQFSPESLLQALDCFCAETQSAEVMILSTCNRIEIYTDTDNTNAIIQWLYAYHHIQGPPNLKAFYCYQGTHALKHATRVAASLDSLVMGEPEILGQFKAAHKVAKQAGCIGFQLEALYQHALGTAKYIRTHTQIGHCPVSVAYSALQLCDNTTFNNANIVVLGAGDTAKRMLSHIHENGASSITILNRTLTHAQTLAHTFNAKADTLDNIQCYLSQATVIIGALHTPEPIITRQALSHFSHNILCIDISAPRSIDATVINLPHIKLISIDDIDTYISKNTIQRAKAANLAEDLIQQATDQYLSNQSARQAVPTIIALRENTSQLIETELNNSLVHIQNGQNPEWVLKAFAHKLKQKWLHSPSKALHSAAKAGNHDLVKLAQTLFEL
jgi:glutamyl-tRNA reductase